MPEETVEVNDGSEQETQVIPDVTNLVNDLIAQRDNALLENAALSTILGKHNISAALDNAKLASLQVEAGKVTGTYDYTPAKIQVPTVKSPKSVDASPVLTFDDLKGMTPAQINENLDAVNDLLKSRQKVR